MKNPFHVCVLCALFVLAAWHGSAEDWPMWRYDANRSGVSPEKLPSTLYPQWICQYPPVERAWPDEDRMEFDVVYEPVVAGKTMYFGSSRTDTLRAVDTETGIESWTFYADGPIRLAPAVAGGRVYFCSDDGYLYCLDAASGALIWKFRGAPSERKVLGNTRMISVWPARGAPVVADETVYFGAGIWSFEGVFLYALRADTGELLWSNDTCDVPYTTQPHRSPAFAGVTPQGYLAVSGDKLLVPSGRAVAACVDRRTGTLDYFDLEPNNRHGGYRVAAAGDYFFNPSALYELETGRNLGPISADVALTEDTVFLLEKQRIHALDLTKLAIEERKDKRERVYWQWSMPDRWSIEAEATNFIVAGERVYACKPGGVFAMDVPRRGKDPKISWEAPIEGTPRSLLAADEKLFVVTEEGRIYCFGGKKVETVTHDRSQGDPGSDAGEWAARAAGILKATTVTEGYGLVAGIGSADLLLALARQSKLELVAIEPDAATVATVREQVNSAPEYAGRIAVMTGDLGGFSGPPYWATLILCAAPENVTAEFVQALYHPLRPYGGVACLLLSPAEHDALVRCVTTEDLAGAEVSRAGDFSLVKRTGVLPGAANWTHQYADAANTVVSKDSLVRAPLGLLWYGGSSNADILPRHGHGPSEQVVDGRLFIEGPDMLRALDVYTGRVLWQAPLEGLGARYDNTGHQPGANAIGSNYVSVHDGVYVAYGAECLRLDPATGQLLNTFTLPIPEGASEPPQWGYIGVWEDLLVAGSGPVIFDEEILGHTWNAVASKRVVAMDRYTGEARWSHEAILAFRHNAIAIGAGKVFCLDGATDEFLDRMRRRGIAVEESGRILAFDARTGAPIWEVTQNVFGTWLGYSEEHDILLQSGRPSRDMLKDEPNDRMIAHRGRDGSVVWDRAVQYDAPCMLHGDTIIAQERAFNLLTGAPVLRRHPLTGIEIPRTWTRNYGCNSAIASQYLVTFRSAAAGFFDLESEGGTGNLGGFKSGCTSNLIAACGVLNAPDYTRTCTCSYQNQTSLAFVHTPSVEMWTFNDIKAGDVPIRCVGLNLGAPGDRRAENGTLWLDYPSVGGPSPDIPVEITPKNPTWFRQHSLRMRGDGLNWVAASGGKHIASLRVTLNAAATGERAYTVSLYFAEPDGMAPGQRLFDVALQGATVLQRLDIAAEAGGPMRALVKEFKGVVVKDDLVVTLTPRTENDGAGTVLCGIEIVEEE